MAKDKIVVKRLKACLAELGMTQGDLAQKIGINQATLSLKVCGRSEFTRDEIAEIKHVLALSDNDLLTIFFPTSWVSQQYQQKQRLSVV